MSMNRAIANSAQNRSAPRSASERRPKNAAIVAISAVEANRMLSIARPALGQRCGVQKAQLSGSNHAPPNASLSVKGRSPTAGQR